MQQGIYCIDASQNPPLLVYAKLDQKVLSVEQSQELVIEQPAMVANGGAGVTISTTSVFASLAQQAKQILGVAEQDLLGPIVLLSGRDYLSLNIDLPISDPTRIGKVIDMEVQDLVPFESTDFILHHRVLGSGISNAQDVHIAALPKAAVQSVLEGCRSADLEPLMICSATSAMISLYKLFAPAELESDCLLLHLTPNFCYLVTMIEGQARFDRVLDLQNLYGEYTAARDRFSLLLQQITLTVRHISEKYQREIKTIYRLGGDSETVALLDSSALNIKALATPADLKCPEQRALLGAASCSMVATPALDTQRGKGIFGFNFNSWISQSAAPLTKPFVDFRTREFAYRAPLKRLGGSYRRLLPWLGITVALVCLSVTSIYQIKSRYLSDIYSQLQSQISTAINDPDFKPNPGEELTGLLQKISGLDASLKDLGSPSRLNALYVLSKLSRTINRQDGASVRLVSIKGSRVRIEGEAPDYAYVEELERSFNRLLRRSKDTDKQRRKQIYCEVKKGEGGGANYGSTAKQFKFELALCD